MSPSINSFDSTRSSMMTHHIKSTNFLIVLAGRTETIDTQIKDEQKFTFSN